MKILSVKRGGDPICVLPGEMVSDSLLVTGGAAGQSGLAYGMRAGSICGTVAAEAVAAMMCPGTSSPSMRALEVGVLLGIPHGQIIS